MGGCLGSILLEEEEKKKQFKAIADKYETYGKYDDTYVIVDAYVRIKSNCKARCEQLDWSLRI